MKKFLLIFLSLCNAVSAQTFPVQNLTVAGFSTFTGQSTFTLSPTGPTPLAGDNTTKMATTAFVQSSLFGLPYAPLLSPNFSGTPTAPTQGLGDATTALATDAFVQRAVGGFNGSVGVTAPVTLGILNVNNILSVSGAGIVTLPVSSTYPNGTSIRMVFRTSGSSILAQGSDQLFPAYGSATVSNFNAGDEVTVTSNGAGGWVLSGVKHQACANVMDNGGNNTASANNDTAWVNALNSTSFSFSHCVYFPAGYYNFSNVGLNYSVNGTSITVKGDGPGVSVLRWTAGNAGGGINFTTTNGTMTAHVRDLSILGGGVGGGAALSFNNTSTTGGPAPQSQSDVTNVEIRGLDGFNATDYWSFGIAVNNWSQWNFTNVFVGGGSNFSGTGVVVQGTAAPTGIVYNFQGCTFNFLSVGIVYGNYIQGVTVNQSNFDTNIGVSVPVSQSNLDQLAVTASQFGINTGRGIDVESLVPNTQITGNLFIVPVSSNGIVLNNTGLFTIVGNSFNEGTGGSGRNGINISNSAGGPGVITGNIFDGMVGGSGVLLQSTSSNVNVQSNVYSGNTNNVSNSCSSGCTVGGGSQ